MCRLCYTARPNAVQSVSPMMSAVDTPAASAMLGIALKEFKHRRESQLTRKHYGFKIRQFKNIDRTRELRR